MFCICILTRENCTHTHRPPFYTNTARLPSAFSHQMCKHVLPPALTWSSWSRLSNWIRLGQNTHNVCSCNCIMSMPSCLTSSSCPLSATRVTADTIETLFWKRPSSYQRNKQVKKDNWHHWETYKSECCVCSPKALACNGLPTYLCKKIMCRSQFLMIALFWSIFLSYSLSLLKAPQDEMVYIGWTVNIWLVWDRLPEVELGRVTAAQRKKHFCTEVYCLLGLFFPCCNIIQI